MNGEPEIFSDGITVWVNDGVDGSCIGRFSKKFGIDVHNTGTDQVAGKGECLYCTHGPAGPTEWERFRSEMFKHYQIEVPEDLLTF